MLGTMQVADGVHGVKLDFGEVFVTDPVELGGRLRGGGPRHVCLSGGKVQNEEMEGRTDEE